MRKTDRPVQPFMCSHRYHRTCILQYSHRRGECVVCRAERTFGQKRVQKAKQPLIEQMYGLQTKLRIDIKTVKDRFRLSLESARIKFEMTLYNELSAAGLTAIVIKQGSKRRFFIKPGILRIKRLLKEFNFTDEDNGLADLQFRVSFRICKAELNNGKLEIPPFHSPLWVKLDKSRLTWDEDGRAIVVRGEEIFWMMATKDREIA